jgi:hypothetical protein
VEGDAALLHRRRDRPALAPGLGDQHADLRRVGPAGQQVLDLAGNRLGLRALVGAAPEADSRLPKTMLKGDHLTFRVDLLEPRIRW